MLSMEGDYFLCAKPSGKIGFLLKLVSISETNLTNTVVKRYADCYSTITVQQTGYTTRRAGCGQFSMS